MPIITFLPQSGFKLYTVKKGYRFSRPQPIITFLPQSGFKIYTVKKGQRFSRPQLRCHQSNSPWPGIIKLFPARESLVSDIPTGDGKISNLFYSVVTANPVKNREDVLLLGQRKEALSLFCQIFYLPLRIK